MSLVKSNILKRKLGLPWQHIEGQALILNPEKHEAHELNEVASFVWSELDGETDLSTIISKIALEFEVIDEQVDTDIMGLANSFIDLELAECL